MATVEYVFILLCMADVKLDVNVFKQRRVEWLVVMDNEKATFGGVVDRYVALVYSLLPALYDVSVLGWEVKRAGGFAEGIEERWERVGESIASWQRSPLEILTSIYTGEEVIVMCTQGNIYRQLGLLLLHRHWYRFVTEDIAATAYADTIFSEVETCSRLAGETPFKIGRVDSEAFWCDKWDAFDPA
ncbi:hypothetical protein BJX68DRAFT_264132 [Aspergillus pseudodeflectus]|uniref:Uncharacterized protein n=1 Tax=Aspergillus pseudodeflectus TaxID=176178 RepID=A0ABR4KU33_9EURO